MVPWNVGSMIGFQLDKTDAMYRWDVAAAKQTLTMLLSASVNKTPMQGPKCSFHMLFLATRCKPPDMILFV